jgi:hypothetical protein
MSTGMRSFEPRSARLTHCVKFSGKNMITCYHDNMIMINDKYDNMLS